MIKTLFVFFAFAVSSFVNAQNISSYLQQNQSRMLEEYVEFLAIPNVSTDTVNILRNAEFIKQMMQRRGIKAELLHGRTKGVSPAVYGEIITPGAKTTIGFYAHYDGQPVNPKQWHDGLEPFTPVIISAPLENGGKIIGPYKKGDPINSDYRISGRGSADDKAGVMTILNAYEALVKTGSKLSANIKFLFEGEEEVGSIHLNEIFELNKQKLQADAWIIADGPRHISGRKTISFGVRGDVNVHLTVYGAKRPLHSGNYGNWAPNPALSMVHLLASMKDENGKVLVKDFYNDVTPLSDLEKQAITQMPDIETRLKNELGLKEIEIRGRSLGEAVMTPSLNINGMASGNVGSLAANVIPVKAEAVLDLRLVKGNDWKKQVQKVVSHIKSKGFHILKSDPTDEERMKYDKLIKIETKHGYNAQRTSMDLPISKKIQAAVQSTSKEPIVLIPSGGGSLPLYLFEEILGTKVISIPVVNYDNNQHAENENVIIRYLWEGIETIAAVMKMK
jgi:acetylornithine deacetylase/succinyl-diaminopimelate desuccinylase-like protein